jgi:hypothetical protein
MKTVLVSILLLCCVYGTGIPNDGTTLDTMRKGMEASNADRIFDSGPDTRTPMASDTQVPVVENIPLPPGGIPPPPPRRGSPPPPPPKRGSSPPPPPPFKRGSSLSPSPSAPPPPKPTLKPNLRISGTLLDPNLSLKDTIYTDFYELPEEAKKRHTGTSLS